ncbi:MAG: DUF3536 domain-containing protein [Bacteroidia bacterium]|nr:DUF3536 domain-containing protein [Bacteroidia bacterium]MDW8300847.1 DUF3536 domain-containing protein [Bacteroidia bacterium]
MQKYICIHGHFYQPPRENAWLEEIEVQESAYPFHDWNERITSECYAPNGFSRILNEEHKIIDIVNNYSKISFNFGATLLSWMQYKAPTTYQAILEGDKLSMKYFNGHGSAMAQVYNHIIMPLANTRDKETQVIWGIRDFEYRFGRKPEGMWLAETAVDIETLEILAKHHIKFTILAPHQAKRYRKIGTEQWYNGIETRKHYICKLPSGKQIILFFYDAASAEQVAFKGILDDGKRFAHQLVNSFNPHDPSPQLVHIATDGESYGHHHRHGDMALAYCLRYIEENNLAKITNYSQYIHLFEPEYEVEIYENSSWSCAHGIERWRSNCGCKTGGEPHFHQLWRKPLREALDWLRDELAKVYETELSKYISDVWKVRNAYIDVILDRSPENVNRFLKKHFKTEHTDEDKTKILRLLEMQRQCLLMFTSCAWFFNDISGIETIQVLQYANRAIQLAETASNQTFERAFLEKIYEAKSNLKQYDNGAEIYTRYTSPARITLSKVGMHYAVASLFEENPQDISVLNYDFDSEYFERLEAGLQKLAIGKTWVHSKITYSKKYFCFAVVYLGQHQIIGSSTPYLAPDDFNKMANQLKLAFKEGNLAEVLQIMQIYFPVKHFSFWELFKDEQTKVLNKILEDNLKYAEESYERIYHRNYHLLNVMQKAQLKIPAILKQNFEIVINNSLKNFFIRKSADIEKFKQTCQEVAHWRVNVDKENLSHVASIRILEMVQDYEKQVDNEELLDLITQIIRYLRSIAVDIRLGMIQNILFKISKRAVPHWTRAARQLKLTHYPFIYPEEKDDITQRLLKKFIELCSLVNLKIMVEPLVEA